ncbi:MAG: biopolymer transporter ExbD [Bdellovibrionota bacterium]
MFRKPGRKHSGSDGHGGLMITPLLDMLVALIPILILGVVLTRINVVDVSVSKPVQSISKPKPSNFDLLLKVGTKEIDLVLNGKTRLKVAKESTDSLDKLHSEIVSIKREFPQEFEIKVEPESQTALDNIMEVIDAAREVKNGDPEMIRKDEATGKDVKIKFLFPRVILRGVYS